MKASELRIGNLILGEVDDWKVGRVVAINVIGGHDVSLDIDSVSYLIKDLQPIPLTEEWLGKFGFENERGLFKKNGIIVGLDGDDSIKGQYSVPYDGEFLKVSHVHQLQNLFFALTGEELEIKQ
jgi:hypothetical protein